MEELKYLKIHNLLEILTSYFFIIIPYLQTNTPHEIKGSPLTLNYQKERFNTTIYNYFLYAKG